MVRKCTLAEGKVISIRAEYLSAIWRIVVTQALQGISQKSVIVHEFNAEVGSMHRILWGLFYVKKK